MLALAPLLDMSTMFKSRPEAHTMIMASQNQAVYFPRGCSLRQVGVMRALHHKLKTQKDGKASLNWNASFRLPSL